MTKYASIIGWGMFVPERIMTNQELSTIVETSDEWIRSRTGIEERHIADPKEATSDLAIKAAWAALHRADLDPGQLDLIIVATCSPDYHMPSTACIVQDALGATHAAAFDMNAACSGFVYALSVGSQSIVAGTATNVLVIGAETFTRWLDWTQRETCVLFGDGAGAVVLQASDQPAGLLSYSLGSDGSGANLLIIRNGGSRVPPQGYLPADGLLYMNGKEVYRFATRIIGKAVRDAVERAKLNLTDIKLIIPHQANSRIIEAAAKSLGVPMENWYVNVNRYGNTSAASIPIALCEAVDEGRLQPGDHVCLVGFGAGLTWAAATIKWAPPLPAPQTGVTRRLARWSRAPLARVKSLIHRAERKIDFWEARQGQSNTNSVMPNGHISQPTNGAKSGVNGHSADSRPEPTNDSRNKPALK